MSKYSDPITATGSLISLDAPFGGLFDSLSVPITPTQDLNGYDHPWPAGGGKNKCEEEFEDGYINASGVLSVRESAIRSKNYNACLPSTNYCFVHKTGMNGCTICWYDSEKTFLSRVSSDSGTEVVTSPSNAYFFKLSFYNYKLQDSDTYNNDVAFNYPSTITTYSPYSNICPISGRTGVSVYRTGKNLADISNAANATNVVDSVDADGKIHFKDVTARWSSTYIGKMFVKAGETYTLSGGIAYGRIGLSTNTSYPQNGVNIPDITVLGGGSVASFLTKGRTVNSFTANYTGYMYAFYCSDTNYAEAHGEFSCYVFCNVGSTATTYEPYTGNTYAVDWTTEAGTVYGCHVNPVTGVLTLDRAMVDLGTLTYSVWNKNSSRDCYSLTIQDIRPRRDAGDNLPAISSIFVSTNYNATWNPWQMSYTNQSKQVVFMTPHDEYADADAFKAAMSGVQLVYELATPLTYQLTGQEIAALVGTNNVWVDTSAVITLIYRLLQVDRQTDRTSIGKRAESLDVLGKFSSISKVEVNVTENLFYEAGDSSGRTLTVDCPFGTQAMANNLLAVLQGYVYQPFEARRSIANPATELGDGVTVGDVYGGIYAIYHKCGPLHLADLSAPADEEIDHEYKFTPAFERKVERRLNNMQSELSVQAGEISAKVDRQGGDPSSVSWKMDADVFKVAVDGSDVLTVNENGLTVNGDGNFTGNVYAGNIQYGGSAGTMSGNGITSRSIGTGRLTSGINVSLGNADYSADVFSGAVVARFTKANVMMTTTFTFNQRAMKLNTRTVKDGSGNNVTIQYLGAY